MALGADPATILGAVTPVPDSLSEYQFAGLLRGGRTEIVKCLTHDLQVPATAEIVLEGFIQPDASDPSGYETAAEGPFGDHTGYYNEVERFPVLTIERMTLRRDPIYHSTYTGKPPDEPAVLGVALNEVFVPLLQKQFPEIADFYLPPEGCSYRLAVVSMRKQYAGHAKRVMFGVWSFLRQFMYTKFIVVTDDDVDIRDWKEVIWALTTRVDPARDTLIVESTPIDYLDFASPVAGLGSKMGIDATNKWPGETQRHVGPPDRDGRGRQGARRCAVSRTGTLAQLRSYLARHARKMRNSVAIVDSLRTIRPSASAAEQGQRHADQRGGDGARRAAARGRRRRRDNSPDGMPCEQRLHALQVRLRDQTRLALGQILDVGLIVAAAVHRPREGRAILLELGDRCRERKRRSLRDLRRAATGAARPATAKNSDHAEDGREAVRVPEVDRPRPPRRRTARTAGSRSPRPGAPAVARRARVPRCTRPRRARAACARDRRSASASRASAPRNVAPPASRSGASLMAVA